MFFHINKKNKQADRGTYRLGFFLHIKNVLCNKCMKRKDGRYVTQLADVNKTPTGNQIGEPVANYYFSFVSDATIVS